MQNIPLHPVLVHFPIVLAVLAPLVALYSIVSFRRRRELPRTWNLLVFVLVLALLGGIVATRSGEAEEGRVERFVGHASLEAHEDLAGSFVPVAAVLLLLALVAPLVHRRRAACAGLALLVLCGTVALAAITLRIGHSGGELVYLRGAARAYGDAVTALPPSTPSRDHERPDRRSTGDDRVD